MPIVTSTTTTVTGFILGASALLLRRRISRSWIDVRSNQYEQLSSGAKTIVITGGNTGLGYEAAKDFARRNQNGNVVIACRDTSKGHEAVSSISKSTGNENVSCLELDLASLESVKKFITEVQTKHPSINALICNAGVWVPMEYKMKTKEGYEIHFGVNHLSHHLIAKSLVPQLEKSMDGRIVFISSALMKAGKIELKNNDSSISSVIYEGRVELDENGKTKKSRVPTGYSDSKLMNALTCKYMASILPPTVTTYAACPGFCRSSLGRHVRIPSPMKLIVVPIMRMIQRTQTQGAQNIVFVTGEDKENLKSGFMYRDGEIMKEHMDHVENVGGDVTAKELWEFSEELLGKH